MAADVLPHAEQRRRRPRTAPSRAARRSPRTPPAPRAAGRAAAATSAARDAQVALDARRLDRDRLERALAADAARRRRVEAALQRCRGRAGRVDLDRVRGEIVGKPRAARPQALREAEAERELLVVAGRPHRHRDGRAADPDLERLLDRDDVVGLRRPERASPGRAPSSAEALSRLAAYQRKELSDTGISIVTECPEPAADFGTGLRAHLGLERGRADARSMPPSSGLASTRSRRARRVPPTPEPVRAPRWTRSRRSRQSCSSGSGR